MIHNKLSIPEFCLLLWYFPSLPKEFYKIRQGFIRCFQKMADEKETNYWKFLDAARVILQVTDKLIILRRITIEMIQVKVVHTHANC